MKLNPITIVSTTSWNSFKVPREWLTPRPYLSVISVPQDLFYPHCCPLARQSQLCSTQGGVGREGRGGDQVVCTRLPRQGLPSQSHSRPGCPQGCVLTETTSSCTSPRVAIPTH
ncbi:hypothetical protein E2C01_082323 [Portunus trituberculatus]|uniref:Uncharacterized protein n=1 Tax=Portunus trituberculatus TaxID=210409 RepID=A0A5B7IPM1_PORTR|nr:hypothetical protein [Portunus trituberculatus]